MLLKALTLAAVASLAAAGGVPSEMVEHLKCMTFYKACMGKDVVKQHYTAAKEAAMACQQEDVMFDKELFRADDGEVTDLDEAADKFLADLPAERKAMFDSFANSLEEMKQCKMEKLSNLTCVMRKTKMWTEENEVNMEFLRDGYFAHFPGDQMELKNALKEVFEKCHIYASAIPMAELTDHPLKIKFGKQMKFHKCVHKFKTDTCAKKLMADYMFGTSEMPGKYGPFTPAKAVAAGLPNDPYEAAYIKMKVKKYGQSDSLKFVMKMLFEGPQ